MTAFTIRVEDFPDPIGCPAGTTALDAIRASQASGVILSGCRGGGCGVCRVRVLSGRYRCDRMSRAHVSVDDEAHGFALACQLRPEGDIELQVVGRLAKACRSQWPVVPNNNDERK